MGMKQTTSPQPRFVDFHNVEALWPTVSVVCIVYSQRVNMLTGVKQTKQTNIFVL